jgi:cytochrome c oxidase subunit 2
VRYWSVALLALRAVLLSGCGAQSPLDPHGPPARDISTLFWWMLAVSAVVILGALGLLAVAWWRRGTEGLPLLGRNERASTGLVIGFGVVIPLISLCVVFAVANLSVASNTDAPRARTTSLTVEVIGHQWFWEVRYPGTDAVTANEIHIPARTRVNVVVRSADVIHSFWAPQLNRKVDAVPGRSNRLLLYADEPGRYRGDCAELCGIPHARMGLAVYADPPAEFRAWLADMSKPAPTPGTSTAMARAGGLDDGALQHDAGRLAPPPHEPGRRLGPPLRPGRVSPRSSCAPRGPRGTHRHGGHRPRSARCPRCPARPGGRRPRTCRLRAP